MEAKSEGLGKGSLFTITLPLIKGRADADTKNTPEEVRPVALAIQGRESPGLMIVDDNRDAGQLLATLLKAKGYQVLRHESVESALADVALPGIPVFILNIGLPGMDGFELARRLRANPATQCAVRRAGRADGFMGRRTTGSWARRPGLITTTSNRSICFS